MDEEAKRLLSENNRLLRQVITKLDKLTSICEHSKLEQFAIDVCANLFTETMLQNEKNDILNQIRK